MNKKIIFLSLILVVIAIIGCKPEVELPPEPGAPGAITPIGKALEAIEEIPIENFAKVP